MKGKIVNVIRHKKPNFNKIRDDISNYNRLNIEKKSFKECYKDRITVVLKDVNIDEIPNKISFKSKTIRIDIENKEMDEIDKVIEEDIHQCEFCLGICPKGKCAKYNQIQEKRKRIQSQSPNLRNARLMGYACRRCGETCGHWDNQWRCPHKNERCIHCGSHDHSSYKSSKCPKWTTYAIRILIFKQAFIQNSRTRRTNTPNDLNYWIPRRVNLTPTRTNIQTFATKKAQIAQILTQVRREQAITKAKLQRINHAEKYGYFKQIELNGKIFENNTFNIYKSNLAILYERLKLEKIEFEKREKIKLEKQKLIKKSNTKWYKKYQEKIKLKWKVRKKKKKDNNNNNNNNNGNNGSNGNNGNNNRSNRNNNNNNNNGNNGNNGNNNNNNGNNDNNRNNENNDNEKNKDNENKNNNENNKDHKKEIDDDLSGDEMNTNEIDTNEMDLDEIDTNEKDSNEIKNTIELNEMKLIENDMESNENQDTNKMDPNIGPILPEFIGDIGDCPVNTNQNVNSKDSDKNESDTDIDIELNIPNRNQNKYNKKREKKRKEKQEEKNKLNNLEFPNIGYGPHRGQNRFNLLKDTTPYNARESTNFINVGKKSNISINPTPAISISTQIKKMQQQQTQQIPIDIQTPKITKSNTTKTNTDPVIQFVDITGSNVGAKVAQHETNRRKQIATGGIKTKIRKPQHPDNPPKPQFTLTKAIQENRQLLKQKEAQQKDRIKERDKE